MENPFQQSLFGQKTAPRKTKYKLKLSKLRMKLNKKAVLDYKEIEEILSELQEGEVMALFSNVLDAPNIIGYFLENESIERIIIGTWAITNSGISILNEVVEKTQATIDVVMDKLHSSKWVFASGAVDILKGRVNFHFIDNHSKFICIKTNHAHYSFIGSMNLSNNPRFENVFIEKSTSPNGLFEFCDNFVSEVKAM